MLPFRQLLLFKPSLRRPLRPQHKAALERDVARLEAEKAESTEARRALESERASLTETKAAAERENAGLVAAKAATSENLETMRTELTAAKDEARAARDESVALRAEKAKLEVAAAAAAAAAPPPSIGDGDDALKEARQELQSKAKLLELETTKLEEQRAGLRDEVQYCLLFPRRCSSLHACPPSGNEAERRARGGATKRERYTCGNGARAH